MAGGNICFFKKKTTLKRTTTTEQMREMRGEGVYLVGEDASHWERNEDDGLVEGR